VSHGNLLMLSCNRSVVRKDQERKKMNKVMIIEDSQSDLYCLFNRLENDYEIITLKTPSCFGEIQEIAQYLQPDLILFDFVDKKSNIKDICSRLKKDDSTSPIPIIIVSAVSDIDSKLECFNRGAADYICKPFHEDELMARINTIINQYRHTKNLIKTIKEKEKQIAIIIHDLKDLFSGIFGYLCILDDNYDVLCDDEKKNYINSARTSSESLFLFVDGVIEWALKNYGFSHIKPELIRLADFVESIKYLLHNVSVNKSIEIKNEISNHINIINDKAVLSTVLRNLLFNALKFTPEGGKVLLTAESNEASVILHVSDTGLGIGHDTIEQIMAGESAGSTLGTNSENGHGFGLLVCKELIEKCGGRLSISSAIGAGSKFSIFLPLQITGDQ